MRVFNKTAKHAMKQHAVLEGADNSSLMIQVQTPDHSYIRQPQGEYRVKRSFVYIPDGQHFIDRVYPGLLARAQQRDHWCHDLHVFEIIQSRRPAKPCFDFDHKGGLPDYFTDRADFQAKIMEAITRLFDVRYGVKLAPTSFMMNYTDNPAKFSATSSSTM